MLEGDSMAKPTLRKGTTSLCLIFRLIQVAQHVFFKLWLDFNINGIGKYNV